jgi:voltage-gated sodium channel
MTFPQRCASIASRPAFQRFILCVILFNAILVGVETDRILVERFGTVLFALNKLVLGVFIVEISLRLIACWPRLGTFFRDGWNVFDLVIVLLSLIPAVGPMTTVARLARVLRVLRLVSVSPELRLIVATMLRSIPSMGHVIVLAGLLIYIYGVAGTFAFRDLDPAHWGNLGRSCLTLFQVLTTEGWADIQANVLPHAPWSWLYFTSYIIIAVFVVVNLFIAVVTNNLQNAKAEAERASDKHNPSHELLETVRQLQEQLSRFEERVRSGDQRR